MKAKHQHYLLSLRFLKLSLMTLLMSALLWCGAPPAALSADPVLVKDINPGAGGGVSTAAMVSVGSITYFAADDGVHGFELWRTDGTESGTYMVKDIVPGSSGSTPSDLLVFNGLLYFSANGLGELWCSDGTTDGTYMIRSFGSSNIDMLVAVEDMLFISFTAEWSLWKTDGTASGTELVLYIDPQAVEFGPEELTELNGFLYFRAEDPSPGDDVRLWKSDGTELGTVVVLDASGFLNEPHNLTNINGTLFFKGYGLGGDELWKLDGLIPERVADINPGTGSSSPDNLTNFNGTLYFSADDGTYGRELWRSDGTELGTVMVKDIYISSGSYPQDFAALGNTLFFRAFDIDSRWELWKTDGSEEGTVLVADINPGVASSNPGDLTASGGNLYFQATTDTRGTELYWTDETAEHVYLIDIVEGTGSSNPSNFTGVNNLLLFAADDGSHGIELMKIEGSGPAISEIEPQTGGENSSIGPISFSLSDVDTDLDDLVVTATSDNQTLLPDGRLALAGSGEYRTITLAPDAAQTGTAVITISVDDGNTVSTQLFRATWYPSPVSIGMTRYDTIMEAVAASVSGDVIRVTPGTYQGSGFREIYIDGKDITVKSIEGAAATIIDLADPSYHRTGFIVRLGSSAVIDGFTIRNGTGRSTVAHPYYSGGAIHIEDSSPTIQNCVLENNRAEHGGGLYSTGTASSPLISNTSFIDNTASAIGGAAVIADGEAAFGHCSFINNRAVGRLSFGGALHIGSVSVNINASLFKSNSSINNGGAIYADGSTLLTLKNSVFSSNRSQFRGGALYLQSTTGTISNSTFADNYAVNGGAVSVDSTILSIYNSILWGNDISDYPEAQPYGTQIYGIGGGNTNITIGYTNIQGGLADIAGYLLKTSGGYNIDEDPKFAMAEDLRLLPTSPCIDKGTLSVPGGITLTDFDGNPRSVDGTDDGQWGAFPDLGAYEFNLAPIAAISPEKIEFSILESEGVPDAQVINIMNSGTGTLNWEVMAESWPEPWLRIDPVVGYSSGEIKSVVLTVDDTQLLSMVPGNYNAVVRFYDRDARVLLREIPVSLKIGRLITIGGSGDFSTIQGGIDVATEGDVVLVAAGIYPEHDISFEGKDITLMSEDGPEFTTIDAGGSGRAFTFNSGETNHAIVQGFTISNADSAGDGGAIYITASSSATIINCIFSNNQSGSHGGAIFSEGDNTIIRNCQFNSNSSGNYGGAVYLSYNDTSIIEDCVFDDNDGSRGGAVYSTGENVLINNCRFEMNISTTLGGAIFSTSGSMRIQSCYFDDNKTATFGGAIYTSGNDTIVNSIFNGNDRTDLGAPSYGGSAIFLGGTSRVSNCTFNGHTSGGIYGTIRVGTSSTEISNVIIWQAAEASIYNTVGVPVYNSATWDGAAGTVDLSAHPFVDPVNENFQIDTDAVDADKIIDQGRTIDWLFSDYRGSFRAIDGDDTTGAVFDIGAMEYARYFGGVERDQVAKAFWNVRIENSSLSVGYSYNVEWQDKSPFPNGDERLLQAGEYTVNIALVNDAGRRIDLKTVTKTISSGYSALCSFGPEHIGDWRIRLELAEDPNQFVLSDPVSIENRKQDTYYYGSSILPPEGADPAVSPDFEDEGFLYWSTTTNRLYAVGGPRTVFITWYADENRTIPIPTVAFLTMPPDPQIHIAGSLPVELLPEESRFDSVDIKWSDNDSSLFGSEFTATDDGVAVILYRDAKAILSGLEPEVFQVIYTTNWNDSNLNFPGERTIDIGSAVVANQQESVDTHDYSCGNGYVYFDGANIDAHGENKAYDRATREGGIFPVNLDFTGPYQTRLDERDDLVVVWYNKSEDTAVCWPDNPVRYTPQWPSGADTIYIDTGLGTGGLDPTIYGALDAMIIYDQPDPGQPGFNPNEEHAAFFTAPGSEYAGVFPLRNDINRAETSEPYVLLKYIDPATVAWNMKAWRVESSDGDTPFTYSTIAGNEVNAPYPLNQFVYGPCAQSSTSTPENVLKDKDDKLFAFQGDRSVGMHFFYKLRTGFYYDLDGDGHRDALDGQCIAWLDGSDNNWNGSPQLATYDVTWPEPTPTLFVGETLVEPKTQEGELVGLPEIGNQCQVDILYDANKVDGDGNYDPNEVGNSVKLIDPITEYAVDYPFENPEDELPQELKPEYDLGTNRWIFTALPYHIQSRLTYDAVAGPAAEPIKGQLKLKGIFSSGIGEPYLLLNVLTQREFAMVGEVAGGDNESFMLTLGSLIGLGQTDNAITSHTTLKDAELKALTAGDATGTGYVTLAFNNHEECSAPTMLSVIQVGCDLYRGDVKVIESPNPFEEKVTLRHNGDFGGNADDRAFQWRYLPADFPGDPDPNDPLWGEYVPQPDELNTDHINNDLTGEGTFYEQAVDTVIQGSGLQLLPDKWFSTRYYYQDGVCASDSGNPLDSGNFSEWTEPQLYEGWLKRVMKKINLFDQKVTDFHTAEVNSIASMISLAGERFSGDVALSDEPDHLQSLGIIEVYETLLGRGTDLVGTEASSDLQDLNVALLFAANRLADLYMLLGNEAYGDAADPTIGFSTESGDYGTMASSIFSFQNQVDSLLEEELVLLRGRDRTGVKPFWNRLIWNFTLGDGEVAYKENYNIIDQDDDGDIDEYDAMAQYPQGHGDAWGHYLMGMKKYYGLLQTENFTWNPMSENILVGGVPVKVDYRDERKFAAAAAARAKTGAEIVNLTYRHHYTEDPEGQWQGYKDSDSARAWGLDGWAKRAGQAALFDWVVGNAILQPEYNTNEVVAVEGNTFTVTAEDKALFITNLTYPSNYDINSGSLEVKVNGQLVDPAAFSEPAQGDVLFESVLQEGDVVRFRLVPAYGIEKVDRTTVMELWDIVGNYTAIEAEVDKGNNGLNPLGLAKSSIPFDIDPQLVAAGQTHFEQIYGRAVDAMNNAIGVFNHANQSTQMLRRQQDTLADFQRNIENMEADYTNRLIEVYGYPYADDCGPNKTYSTDECQESPDLFHYMYVDASELMGIEAPKVHAFTVDLTGIDPVTPVSDDGEIQYLTDEDENGTKTVTFHVSTDSRFGIIKPPEWQGQRKAPGELQLTRGEMLQTRGRFERGVFDYQELIAQIDAKLEMIEIENGLMAEELRILKEDDLEATDALDREILEIKEKAKEFTTVATNVWEIGQAMSEGIPQTIGLLAGAATGNVSDIFFLARQTILLKAAMEKFEQTGEVDLQELRAEETEKTKEELAKENNIKIVEARNEATSNLNILELEAILRREVSLRHELYVLKEALVQSAQRYYVALAKGDRLLRDRTRFRQQTAAQIQDYRYKDMSFRIFRNEALQKYRAQFDMAAKYVYLAAKAYDYETTLLDFDTMAGQNFLTDIVKQRTIGTIQGGMPLTGSGLADPMKRMYQNFQVLKPQLGINNPQVETNRFSLRQELFRVRMDTGSNETWRRALSNSYEEDLWDVEAFRRYCRPFAPEGIPQPGLVIPFTTTVTSGLNFFKWPLGGGDSYYSTTNYATKVRSVGVWFSNYNSVGLAQTPRVYLVPAGEDVMRTPYGGGQEIRTWQVTDQKLPVPFPIEPTEMENDPGWIPSVDTISDDMFEVRKHSDFRAYHDSGYLTSSEMQYDTRLIGRSVWNSNWLLIIPGQNLLYDADEGIDTFINGPYVLGGTGERTGFGISDIKIFFETYGYSGN